LIFLILLFFVYLLFASVFQGETFSIRQLNVHSSIESKGYNSAFIAKKISYNIATLVNKVPDKLFAMFSSGTGKEKNEILYNRILGKYLKTEIKIDFDVAVGGINLPLHDLTKTARGLLNMEDKSLDGDITVEDSLIIMTLGFNSNGINKSYESKRYIYRPKDTVKMIDVIDRLTSDAAKFVLQQYDPLVTLLIDFNPDVLYSSSGIKWQENVLKEKERLSILKEMYLNEKKDKELAVWAHAITGAIYADKYWQDKELSKYNTLAMQHFEKAIEMDPSFIDIVGIDLINRYRNDGDSASMIRTFRKMIRSNPGNIQVYEQLLEIYSGQNNKVDYFNLLEDAFKNGLYIVEDDMELPQYFKFKDQHQFKALVKKYNEKNKPIF
jgi:hypothetical protein